MSSRERRWIFIALAVLLLILAGTIVGGQAILAILVALAVILVPLGLAWRFAPMPKKPRRLTWNQSIVIIGATILLGNALVVMWPLWLAPPWLSDTPLIYLILAVIWYPITLLLVLMRPTGRGSFAALLLLVIFGGVVCLMGLALAGPNVGIMFYTGQDCLKEATLSGQYRYTCLDRGVLGTGEQLVFEGPVWSPFVTLISRKSTYNPG